MTCYKREIDDLKADIKTLESIRSKWRSIAQRNTWQKSTNKALGDHLSKTISEKGASGVSSPVAKLNDDFDQRCASELEAIESEISKLQSIREQRIEDEKSCPYHGALRGSGR